MPCYLINPKVGATSTTSCAKLLPCMLALAALVVGDAVLALTWFRYIGLSCKGWFVQTDRTLLAGAFLNRIPPKLRPCCFSAD